MKRIVTAVLLSFVGPGLGQIYNKEYRKGVWLLILSLALFFLPLVWLMGQIAPKLPDPQQVPITQEMVQNAALEAIGQGKMILNAISFSFLALWAFSITQAYFKAKDLNDAEPPAERDSDLPE